MFSGAETGAFKKHWLGVDLLFCRQLLENMNRLKGIFAILRLHTFVVTGLAVLSTYLSQRLGLHAEFPMTMITTAVVFPIVFSIGSAFNRREHALESYSALKSHGRILYWAARDWVDDPSEEAQQEMKQLLGDLFQEIKVLLASPREEMPHHEENVYRTFSKLSMFIKHELRLKGVPPPEVGRCNQFLGSMIQAFEDVKHIYQYRSPKTLSSFSDVFVTILPVVYGPYFATLSEGYSASLAYVMPVLFTVILVSLNNIQSHLENPFDQIGQDDLVIHPEKFIQKLELE